MGARRHLRHGIVAVARARPSRLHARRAQEKGALCHDDSHSAGSLPMDVAHTNEAAGAPAPISTKAALLALVGIVALSLFVHLRGLTHDLPAPGADEPYFVLPAARMAWRGD